jgi:hypothetical protein
VRSSTRLVDQTTGWLKNVASIAGSVMGPGDGFRDASARYPSSGKPIKMGGYAQGWQCLPSLRAYSDSPAARSPSARWN